MYLQKNLATQLALMLPSDTAVTETRVEITGIHQDYHSGKYVHSFNHTKSASEPHFLWDIKCITLVIEHIHICIHQQPPMSVTDLCKIR